MYFQGPWPATRTVPLEGPAISTRSSPVIRKPKPARMIMTSPKKGEKGYIPRPRNAFMIFRSDFNIKNNMKTGEDKIKSQASVSRTAGKHWKALDKETKAFYAAEAVKEAHQHLLKHPGYHYSPGARRKKNKLTSVVCKVRMTEAKVCHKR